MGLKIKFKDFEPASFVMQGTDKVGIYGIKLIETTRNAKGAFLMPMMKGIADDTGMWEPFIVKLIDL